jgi:hypothetical protein
MSGTLLKQTTGHQCTHRPNCFDSKLETIKICGEVWWLNRGGVVSGSMGSCGGSMGSCGGSMVGCQTIVLQSQVRIRRLPGTQLTANLLVGCHLG